jgi:nucleotide-binding universal stress UspA family protein
MFKHVLVAIDGSIYSQQALPVAIEIAGKFDAELIVLHVAEHDRGRAAAYTMESPADGTRMVADAVAMARRGGLTARGSMVDKAAGHVPQAIEEAARTNDVDMIVMGSRGLSDAQGFLVGSVTHKVMQMVDIPVLVTRGNGAMKEEPAATVQVAGKL